MKKSCFFYFTFFILLTSQLSLMAQSELRFQNYFLEDGLPHSRVRAIYQDSAGWIWIGTIGGLARFDGLTFTNYNLSNHINDESLSSILCFWEDSNTRLWIGTEADGLILYDREMDSFKNYIINDSSINSISSNQVNSITSDGEGFLWIGTNRGLNRFDPATGSFERFQKNDGASVSLSSDSINKVYIDKKNRLWIGTYSGLNYMDLTTEEFFSFELFDKAVTETVPGKIIQDIVEDPHGNILIGSYYCGLFIIDSDFGAVQNILPDPDYKRSYLIRSVYPNISGELWLGTRGGLYILDNNFNVISHHQKAIHDENSLGHNSITNIFKDRNGGVWVATRSGVSYVNRRSMDFSYYGARINNNKYLNDPEVYAICSAENGDIWFGTEAGGVNILDQETGRFRYMLHNENNDNTISVNSIKAIMQDKRGDFWIGSFLGGLDYYRKDLNRIIHFTHDPEDSRSLINNTVWAIYQDSRNKIWVGTDKGAQTFDLKEQRFDSYEESPLSIPTHVIYEDRSGNLYFGSNYNKLVVIKPGIGRYEFDIPVRVILEDSKGRIWVGSDSNMGLVQFSLEKGVLKTYKTVDGLPSNMIYGLLEDKEQKIWISTAKGLVSFDPEIEEFEVYRSDDGIQGERFYYGAYNKTRDGELLFGGQKGFIKFDPAKLSQNEYVPPVIITNLKIFNKDVPVNEEFEGRVILDKSIMSAKEIEVDYRHSVLTFEFAALNYLNSSKNEYAFMLEGFEHEWNYVGASRTATYTNLDPGEYVFRVKGSNNNGVWNEEGVSLTIKVIPPFVKTTLFKIIMLVIISGILYLILYFIIKREKLKNQLVVERVRSKELHKIDMMKFQFFTNISHEIRTPISLIVSPLSRIRMNPPSKEQILKDIEIVHRNALRLGKLVDQLLDYRKMEAGKLKLELSRGNIVMFLDNVVQMFREMSSEKEVELKFYSALEQLYIYFDADKIEKVLFNLLSNSFKHTPGGGTITVTASLTYVMNDDTEDGGDDRSGEYIQIVVRDTGTGIEEGKIDHIFDRFYQTRSADQKKSYGSGIGLSLSKELIKIHNGRINIKSRKGMGTEVTILFPVVKDNPMQSLDSGSKDDCNPEDDSDKVAKEEVSIKEITESDKPVVLIVEDNKDLLTFIGSVFSEEYMVLKAEDGEEGFKTAMEAIPDIIISDVMMPKMDGNRLCRKLKNDFRTSHVPVILLTALSSKQHEKEGILGGADEYLTKPFDPSLLKIRVDQLLATRRLLREKYSRQNILEGDTTSGECLSQDDKFLAKLINVIEENISDPEFGTVKISREVGVSRTQLYRKLSALTEMTVKEFIRSIRLKKAARLITRDNLNISEAAYAVGFLQVAYFRKCFKDMYGMTPSEYVKKNTLS